MIIEKINIKSFGMIKDMSFELSEGINVIEGQNEAGKSTIAAFIKYMLYGFDSADSEDSDERRSHLNWDDGTAGGSMTVRVKGKRYLISRFTSTADANEKRPTYREESSITDLETGTPAFGKVPAGEVFFGVDKELFENTAFVGQIGDSAINRGSVKESIENILFSGSEKINNQRAASRVKERMQTLLHEGETGGAIYELERRLSDIRERFEKADGDNRLILAKEAKLHELKTEREREERNAEKLAELDRCYENMVIIRNFDKLHDSEKELEEKTDEYRAFIEAGTANDFVPTGAYLTDLAVARRGVDESYRALSDAEAAYSDAKSAVGITKEIENTIARSDSFGGEDAILKRAERFEKQRASSLFYAIVTGAFALTSLILAILGVGPFGALINRILFGTVATLGAAVATATLVSFFKSRKVLSDLEAGFATDNIADLRGKLALIAENRRRRDDIIETTETTRGVLERAKESYKKAQGELSELALRWGGELPLTDVEEYLNALEARAKAFVLEEERLKSERSELEVRVRDMREALSGMSEVTIRAQVSPLKRKVLSEIDHEGITEGIRECKEKIVVLRELATTVEDELAELKLSATDPAELYSKMQAYDTRIAELRSQYDSCRLAYEAICSASENLRDEISPRLGAYATELMEIMTDNKYTGIDVTEGLRVSFLSAQGDKKSADFLSGGTRELTYIAVRMALIDMLYTEKPPVSFDESFAHQDNLRARSMMRAIVHLANEGHQSFIFTCRAREAVLAKELTDKAEVFRLSVSRDAIN